MSNESTADVKMLGWKRDTEEPAEGDPKEPSARAMLGAPIALPSEVMRLVAFVLHVFNQLSTSSCVGHAIMAAIFLRIRFLAADMNAIAQPSQLGIYAFARMREKKRTSDPLKDEGCFPRDAMLALKTDGIPNEADWPFDERAVNEEPPWDVDQKASAHRVPEFYRIDSVGPARVHDIMNALAQDYPVIFGTFVDTHYMRYSGGVVREVNAADPNGGGHMQCIVGYTTDAQGKVWFRVLNSWGPEWGEGGFAWVHEDVINDPESGDFYVIQVSIGSKPAKEAA